MQNEIMDAVTRRLDELFGDGCKIYTDNVEQGLETPCFFVGFLKTDVKQMLGRRSQRTYDMRIQYIPEEKQPSRELNGISEQLMEGMEYIALSDGSLMRGTGRSSEISEGMLTFLVSFSGFFIRQEEPVESMMDLDVKGAVT